MEINAGGLLSLRTVRIKKSTRKPDNWKLKSEHKIGNVLSLSAGFSVLTGMVWVFVLFWVVSFVCLFCFVDHPCGCFSFAHLVNIY